MACKGAQTFCKTLWLLLAWCRICSVIEIGGGGLHEIVLGASIHELANGTACCGRGSGWRARATRQPLWSRGSGPLGLRRPPEAGSLLPAVGPAQRRGVPERVRPERRAGSAGADRHPRARRQALQRV